MFRMRLKNQMYAYNASKIVNVSKGVIMKIEHLINGYSCHCTFRGAMEKDT